MTRQAATVALYATGGLKEADVTRQIKDFMRVRQWRPIRFQRTFVTTAGGGFSTGEPGMPDFLFVRYIQHSHYPGLSVSCWVEMKRTKGGKLGELQIKWRTTETLRGAIVLTARDLNEFMSEYSRLFGWLDRARWVDGQAEIPFE